MLYFVALAFLFTNVNAVSANPDIFGQYAVTIDAKTGEVLYEKNAFTNDKVYPASTTKVLTALMLVENIEENEKITLSEFCVGQVRSNSQILLTEGETLDRNEALYAMMVISANDVACAIAEHIGGTEAAFGEMMTERAKELGAEKSKFYTASGLHHPGHYTTAYDMALIGKEAIKHDVILDAMGTKRYTVTTSNQTRDLVNPSKIHDDPDALGGKTGFTNAARNTLMKIDEVDGKRVINVVLRSNLNSIYDDIKKISNYGISTLETKVIVDKEKWSKTLTFFEKEVIVKPEKTIQLTVKKNDTEQHELAFEQTETFTKEFLETEGIHVGTKVGELQVKKKGEIVTVVDVLSTQEVFLEKEIEVLFPMWLKVAIAITVPILIYIGFVIFFNHRINLKRKSRENKKNQ